MTDRAGDFLAGDATGTAGTDFRRPFGVLPGDATGESAVNAMDVAAVKRRMARTAAEAGPITLTSCSPFADVNADGRINAEDVAAVKRHLASRLPPVPSASTEGLFSLERIERYRAVADVFPR